MPMSLLTAYSIYLPASDIRSVATAMTNLPQLLRIETTLWSPSIFAQNLGFTYKSNLVWYKTRKDGGPDGRGVGFYFRNVTELVLFGTRGHMRTLQPGRTQTNILISQKREHSRKPDEIYTLIEQCSPRPYLELFARFRRPGWDQWGNEDVEANTNNGVAMRKGHVEPQLRLLEAPPGYSS